MNSATLLLLVDLIDLAVIAATKLPAAVTAFEAHMNVVRGMVAEGRDPTDAERVALKNDIASLRSQLHAPLPD